MPWHTKQVIPDNSSDQARICGEDPIVIVNCQLGQSRKLRLHQPPRAAGSAGARDPQRREMPGMDGKQVFRAASEAGVNRKRIIIMSCHPANRLHEEFDPLGCLAVIEKAEPEQQAAFLMILDSIMKR
jgi:hypothetical protein